jgi:hypothetical protein
VDERDTLIEIAVRTRTLGLERLISEKPRMEVFVVIDVERRDISLGIVEKRGFKRSQKSI